MFSRGCVKTHALELKGIAVVAAFAVGEIVSAKRLCAVVTCSAAGFGGTRKVHRHSGCTHLPRSRSTLHTVTARTAHPLFYVDRMAEVDAVRTRCLRSANE